METYNFSMSYNVIILSTIELAIKAMNVLFAPEGDTVPSIPRIHTAQLCKDSVKISLEGPRSSTNSSFVQLSLYAIMVYFRVLLSLNRIHPLRIRPQRPVPISLLTIVKFWFI